MCSASKYVACTTADPGADSGEARVFSLSHLFLKLPLLIKYRRPYLFLACSTGFLLAPLSSPSKCLTGMNNIQWQDCRPDWKAETRIGALSLGATAVEQTQGICWVSAPSSWASESMHQYLGASGAQSMTVVVLLLSLNDILMASNKSTATGQGK